MEWEDKARQDMRALPSSVERPAGWERLLELLLRGGDPARGEAWEGVGDHLPVNGREAEGEGARPEAAVIVECAIGLSPKLEERWMVLALDLDASERDTLVPHPEAGPPLARRALELVGESPRVGALGELPRHGAWVLACVQGGVDRRADVDVARF